MYSTRDAVSFCWTRCPRPEVSIDLEKAINPCNITFTIPLNNREIFVPKALNEQYAAKIYDLRNTDSESDGTIIVSVGSASDSFVTENSLSRAFCKSFPYFQIFQKWFIQSSEFITMGKGMIIGSDSLPLLVAGHTHIKGCEPRKKVLIDKSVFAISDNPKTAAFIKNTLLKYFLGTNAEVEIASLKDLCSLRRGPVDLIGNEDNIKESIARNAEKLFYEFYEF